MIGSERYRHRHHHGHYHCHHHCCNLILYIVLYFLFLWGGYVRRRPPPIARIPSQREALRNGALWCPLLHVLFCLALSFFRFCMYCNSSNHHHHGRHHIFVCLRHHHCCCCCCCCCDRLCIVCIVIGIYIQLKDWLYIHSSRIGSRMYIYTWLK